MPHRVQFPMLVIDAGNTSVKFALVARAGASPKLLRSVPTARLSVTAAKRAGAKAKSVTISSVVPSASRILKRAFPAARFLGPSTPLPLPSEVNRKTLGSDRLANVAAAHAKYGRNVLVASFGTAATFDLIDDKGIHRGGAIAPGWSSFAGILSARTALLPRTGAKKATRIIARNTLGALNAGVNGGYAALVTHIVTGMKKEAGIKNLRVVFTGGDAAEVAGLLPWKAVSDPLLTLRGIAVLAGADAREASK